MNLFKIFWRFFSHKDSLLIRLIFNFIISLPLAFFLSNLFDSKDFSAFINYFFTLALLGIAVGSLFITRNTSVDSKYKIEFTFYSYLCFASSLLLILFLGYRSLFFLYDSLSFSNRVIAYLGSLLFITSIFLLTISFMGLFLLSFFQIILFIRQLFSSKKFDKVSIEIKRDLKSNKNKI